MKIPGETDEGMDQPSAKPAGRISRDLGPIVYQVAEKPFLRVAQAHSMSFRTKRESRLDWIVF
jgi:hypothetical protein